MSVNCKKVEELEEHLLRYLFLVAAHCCTYWQQVVIMQFSLTMANLQNVMKVSIIETAFKAKTQFTHTFIHLINARPRSLYLICLKLKKKWSAVSVLQTVPEFC